MGSVMTDLPAKEDLLISNFNELGDWFLQYEFLLEFVSFMDAVADDEKNEDNRVAGCQSNVWLVMSHADGCIKIRAFSDSLIIRGILALIIYLLDGRTRDEILTYEMRLIEQTALKEQLSTDRFKGMAAVVEKIKAYASKKM